MEQQQDLNDPERRRAFAELVSQHYAQLKDIAQRTLRAEHETAGFGAAALAPTSLVTETVIRLMDQRDLPASDSHLRGLASVFMTRVIADRRRNRLAAKRDVRLTQRLDTQAEDELRDTPPDGPGTPRADLELLERAMIEQAATHPRQMEVVTLHSVAGIAMDRVAAMVGISLATAHRDFAEGRALLARRLRSLRDQ
jgi:DNA-directed RNA polymerase specialized sigma24 family protein